MKIIFAPEATLELYDAVLFYEQARPGLGKAFLELIESGVEAISSHPETWRRIKGCYRRYLVKRFPYGIIYTLHSDTIFVAAFMHLRRKPGYWLNRTSGFSP